MLTAWKGKEPEDVEGWDPEELNPTITYRHLLSSGLGVRNPLRVCGLSDMDAFYAACEQIRLGIDSSVPLVVRQWDALIAVNYPAREYGISRMDKISSALQRCPHLRVVHVATFDPSVPDAKPIYIDNPNGETHKVSLDHYRKESKKIMSLFKEMLPGAEVERASIDEAFIDFTEPVRQQILAYFPHLATPPPEGLDSPLPPPPREGILLSYPPSRSSAPAQGEYIWSGLGTLVPISGKSSFPPPPERESKPSDTSTNSHEPALSEAVVEDGNAEEPDSSTSSTLNRRYQSAELGEAEFQEEEDQHSLSDEEDYNASTNSLWQLQATDVSHGEEFPPTWHDVALSIAASLMLRMRDEVKTRLGYTTSAGIARNKFLAKLVASYKKRDNQTILRNAAIPNYLRPIPFQKIRFLGGKLGTAIAEAYEAQTVGDLLNISIGEMQRNLGEHSIWVWELLRGIDRSEVKEKPPVTKSMGASKNLQNPITHPSDGAHWLRILAGELAFRLREAREENPGLWPKTLVLHVRQAYETARSKQAPFPFHRSANIDYICMAAEKLWGELVGTGAEYDKNKAKGNATRMKITNVFLGFTGIETMATGQRSIEGFFAGNDRLGKRKAEVSESGVVDHVSGKRRARSAGVTEDSSGMDMSLGPEISFHCSRCGAQVQRTIDDTCDKEATLSALKMEHSDFHFAQDLAKQNEGNDISTGSAGGMKKLPKGKAQIKGIAKFFPPVSSKK